MEGKSEQISKKKEFVNSPILSLTTQNDLGVLMPPLNLTFGHIKNVRCQNYYQYCTKYKYSFILIQSIICFHTEYVTSYDWLSVIYEQNESTEMHAVCVSWDVPLR